MRAHGEEGAEKHPKDLTLVHFQKMHGAGNDFIVFDGRYGLSFDPATYAPAMCDRHFGIGADGLLVLENSASADFKMSYYNADGSRTTCGNGMRCIARFIFELGLLSLEQREFDLETYGGTVQVRVFGRGERVRIDMGSPVFDGFLIPTEIGGEHIDTQLELDGERFMVTAVGMGNPHCVLLTADVDRAPVLTLGPKLEHHPFFPERTNVEFVQVVDRQRLKLRVWERGVGETLACGTGVCGAVAALVKLGRIDRQVVVEVLGGELDVHWDSDTDRIKLAGPAESVFKAGCSLGVFSSRIKGFQVV